MSKKSNKTSHVLNLITSRIKVGADGSAIEGESPAINVSHVDHLNIDSAMVNTTLFPDEISQAQLDQFLNSDDEEEDEENDTPSAPPAQLGAGPWGPKPAPTMEEIQSGTAGIPLSVGNDAVDSGSQHPADPANLPAKPVDLNAVSDLIRQELENHLEASISPMTLQDFGDPRQKRKVELPITGGGLKNMDKTDYVINNEEYVYINIMEELVLKEMEALMDRMDMCKCKRCRNDIIALALNKLPCKYVVTQKGYLISKLKSYAGQYHTDVMSAVTSACLKVKESPNHESNS